MELTKKGTIYMAYLVNLYKILYIVKTKKFHNIKVLMPDLCAHRLLIG